MHFIKASLAVIGALASLSQAIPVTTGRSIAVRSNWDKYDPEPEGVTEKRSNWDKYDPEPEGVTEKRSNWDKYDPEPEGVTEKRSN